jgi:arabinose-5-phosphate isomerase
MLTGRDIPVITQEFTAAEAVRILNEKNLGAVLVVDLSDHVVGIVTDGDVRRYVLGDVGLSDVGVCGLMTANPICIESDMQAADALSIMQRHEITVLPIIDSERKLVGILHLHNLLGKGEFRFLV